MFCRSQMSKGDDNEDDVNQILLKKFGKEKSLVCTRTRNTRTENEAVLFNCLKMFWRCKQK